VIGISKREDGIVAILFKDFIYSIRKNCHEEENLMTEQDKYLHFSNRLN
jgi:hypothetical protein